MNGKRIMVIGSSNTDMTVKTAKLPKPGETVLGGESLMGAGGKGANQAVAARRLGADVTFFCKVGQDLFGTQAVAHYEAEGLDVSLIKKSDKPSGIALITVDEAGENCIVVAPGANNDITPEDIDIIADDIRRSSILLMQLEIPVPAVFRAAQIAYEAGVYTVLNPAPACELPEEIFKYIKLLIPNRTETATLTGVDPHDGDSLQKAVEILKCMGVENVVVTLGSEGSAIFKDGDVVLVPAKKVKAEDTTAAGDTFCAGICVGLSEGKSLEEAVEFATAAAAITVTRMGAQSSIPFRSEL